MQIKTVAISAGLAGLLALAACSSPVEPPTNPMVCWRMVTGKDGRPTFIPVSNGVRNLETCAANLEAVSLRENKPQLTGAYQGQFLFITPDLVQSSLHLDGARYRLFDATTRQKIDRDLKWMLQDERHPDAFGPTSPGLGANPK